MSRFTRLYELPVPSSESVTDASLHVHGRRAVLRFDFYRAGEAWRSAFKFDGVHLAASRSERCCASRHIKSFDALIEIVDSPWVDATRNEMSKMYRDEFNPKHYAISLDSAGYFELLAERFEVMAEEQGSWESMNRTDFGS